MKTTTTVLQVADDRTFRVSCEAHLVGAPAATSNSLALTVGQRIRRGHTEQMWDSIGIYAEEDPNGTLVVRVLVFNPDWDEPLQIACVRSRPQDVSCLTPLGCSLDHVTLSGDAILPYSAGRKRPT
jgi:hypothetical protein